MSNNENLTVWQRLSATFGPNSLLNQDIPTYKFDKKELLRTQNKVEFEREKLQAQQSFYLSNQWAKIDNHLYTQAVYYEPTRLASVYDFESMEYSIAGETKIATPNGFITIKELADKGRDYEFTTYAYDHNLKKVVPAKAYNAHYTRDEMTYKITFDDNSHIIATHGHRFLKRDGVFCVVEELEVGDSMMPFYRKSFYNNQNYHWVYSCNKDEGHHGWVKEDVLIAELNPKELNERTFITSKLIPWDLLVETAKKEKSMRNVSTILGISVYELVSKIQVGGFNDWSTFMEAYGLDAPNEKITQKEIDAVLVNHKIISIEPYGVVPVYDLTVPGYKNFATDTIFSHNTPEIGAALDIYAEESTTSNEDGHMLQIYSESKRIKSVLTDLFNNVLDINTSLPMWTRNTPIREDSIIPLLDGTEVTIKELSERIKKGEEVWTYSIQQGTTAIVCSKIIWCDLTRENSELIRVTFDDGTYIDTTPDHEYMLRNGSFMRADLLKPNQSLMPFYTKKSEKSKDKIVDYEKVYNPNTGKYKFTHRMVAHEYVRNLEYENSINENFDTHHIDFRKNNNNPNNLIRLRRSEHFELHIKHYDKILGTPEVIKKRIEGSIKYLKSDSRRERMSNEMKGIYPKYFEEYNNSELHSKHNEIRSLGMLRNWSSSTFIEKTKKGMTIHLNDKCISHITNIILNSNKFIGINELYLTLKKDNEFINLFKETYTLNKNPLKSINPTTLNKLFFRKLNKNYFEFVLSINPNLSLDKKFIKAKSIHLGKTRDITILNHKVVSVTKLDETSNVYCLEAVGPNGEHDRHNFAVCSKDINGNHTRNGVFLANCKFGDNFVFLKLDPEKGIVGCNQLPNIEIERLEPGSAEKASGYGELSSENESLKFKWKNKQMEFQPWEIAHFRILGDDRKLPYGTCLKYDSKVDTEFGIKEIKDVQKGDLVWSFDLNTEQKVLSKVLDTVNSGIKTCYQIHTKHNFIEASKEHKILIYKNNEFIYKNVLDLEIGDCLVIDNTKGQVKEIEINKSKPNENKNGWFNCIDLVPDFVDEEFARFFGFMLGDGWISNNTVCFALSEYDDLNDFYIGILNKYSKNPVKIIEVNGKETQCLVNSKCLKSVMQRMGFIGKAHTKRLPEWVYYSDIKIQKALLEGLMDADGWITQDKWSTHLNIELCNQDLVKDVKILCQKIGYKSGSIRKREPRKNVIIEGRSIKSSNPSFSLTFYDTLLAQTKKHDNDKRKTEDYILEPINKIIEIGEFETHDIYVENENHNFYANGVVVHNSMLEKARRIWKQLLLSEDAMLIYRTSRAPERRVFKVFVGNMDDNDVEAYVQRVANKFKREQIVDSKTGNVDMRYNQMAVDQDYFVPVRDPGQASPIETLAGACISLDTRIPLLDGRVLELSKLIEEWDNGNRNLWAYSCDPHTGDLAPGLITWAGVTRKDTNVLKITLDNGEEVITTPDHKFVHRTNGFVEAQNLKVGDSLMPFYQKQDSQEVWNVEKLNWSLILPPTKTNNPTIETLEKDWELVEHENYNNHKIVSIEIMEERMDTGTITIDGNEMYHNYHTFAIESGIFIKNSNLGEIADIEYIQKKLVTALRIPKTFLGFEDVVGDGKTLSLQDIRFARTINRIQKCMISELNKIAIIHLFLLGFEDEISNFTLGLTNPSTQSDLLKIDIWKEKIGLYRDAVSDPGTGIAPVSATWAKKHIFGFSDEEIRLDLQQQRIEKAVGEELKQTPLIIKKTGLFDNIDKLYGSVSGGTASAGATPPPDDMGGMDMGGMYMGAPPPPPPPPPGGGEMPPPGEPGLAPESRFDNLNILSENNKINGLNYSPFTKGQKSLGDLENELKKLLG